MPKKRINITMDERLVEEIDALTDNRSGFLQAAVINRLHELSTSAFKREIRRLNGEAAIYRAKIKRLEK